MGVVNIVILSVLVGGVAVFFTFDRFEAERQSLTKLLNTCPLHWLDSLNAAKSESLEEGFYNVVSSPDDQLFTKEELAEYHGGEGSKGLYLGILGRVYDVEKGRRFYGEGGGYAFFSAKDGTRAFMSGEFNEKGLIEDATDFIYQQALELEKWVKFYDDSYIYKGKLIGLYYDEEGNPTEALHKVVENLKVANKAQADHEDFKRKFPPCNSAWKQGAGKRLWCSEKSGNVQRDWVGVPREMYKAGSEKGRCVCVRTTGPPSDDPNGKTNRGDLDHPNIRVYKDCDPEATECVFPA